MNFDLLIEFLIAGELDEPGNHDTKAGNNKPDQGEPPSRPYRLSFY